MEVIIYPKTKHSTLTQKQMDIYMEGRLKLEAKSYPYTNLDKQVLTIENNVAYYKPMLEVVNDGNNKGREKSIMIFDTVTDMVDSLMNIYEANENVCIVNGYVGV